MAFKANIIVDQGTDFVTSLSVTDDDDAPIDLSGYTGSAQFRKHYTSETSTSFDVSFSAGSTGIINLSLSRDVTSNTEPGRYVYDVEVTSPANKRSRLVEGILTVTPEVTK